MKKLLLIFLLGSLLFSCQDKIDISKKLNTGKTALVVDAFLNNLGEKQKITLTSTQYYFDNSGPKMAMGAQVFITDMNVQVSYPFTEQGSGEYVSAINGDSILKIGHEYQLSVLYENQNYISFSKVNRITPVDSITFEVTKDFTGKELPGYFDAEFWANDLPGPGDRYWVKNYKNGKKATKASQIGIGYDASSFPTGVTDGVTFILPLRRFSINENDTINKWKSRDSIKVELHSITDETAFFLAQVVTQSSLGGGNGVGGAIGALFSTPPANVPTNIINPDINGSKAVGFFCTSAVSSLKTSVPVKVKNLNSF